MPPLSKPLIGRMVWTWTIGYIFISFGVVRLPSGREGNAVDDRRSLRDRVVVVTGSSRGIGRAIAARVAVDGASVALLAKTEVANPKIAGTLGETAAAVEEVGGRALPTACDVRDLSEDLDESSYRPAEREENLNPNFYLTAASSRP